MIKFETSHGPFTIELFEKEAPINVSNVMIVCSGCGKHARIGRNVLPDGSKVRVCKRCDTTLDK